MFTITVQGNTPKELVANFVAMLNHINAGNYEMPKVHDKVSVAAAPAPIIVPEKVEVKVEAPKAAPTSMAEKMAAEREAAREKKAAQFKERMAKARAARGKSKEKGDLVKVAPPPKSFRSEEEIEMDHLTSEEGYTVVQGYPEEGVVIPPSAPAPKPEPVKELLTTADCAKKLMDVALKKGKPMAVVLLREFKVTKISELLPADFGRFLDACDGKLL